MKKFRLKIFPKTFISSLSLITAITLAGFVLIGVLTPRFYRAFKEETLKYNLDNLVLLSENKSVAEMSDILVMFAQNHSEYGISLQWENGEVIFSRLLESRIEHFFSVEDVGMESGFVFSIAEDDVIGGYIRNERAFRDSNGRALILSLYASLQPIDEVSVVLFRVLPYALLISIALSAAVSFVYAKTITAPVKAISKAAFKMRTLDRDAECDKFSSDEIGELAVNINELYGRLLTTINDLQNEIQNTAAADKEKIDFMLTVSHELKTPLTSVKGMIEGMLCNVGVYKDRDEYLKRCGENIDALTTLLNEILDASKLELSPSPEDYVNANIRRLIKNTAAIHEMIAMSKQISININVSESMNKSIPVRLFEKALSNIISNALKYSESGGTVKIYTDKEKLIIENNCVPLLPEEMRRVFEPLYGTGRHGRRAEPDNNGEGHGLGLYLTERILKVCGLPFEFVPFDTGMRFMVYME